MAIYLFRFRNVVEELEAARKEGCHDYEGVVVARDLVSLWFSIDEFSDPAGFEYLKLSRDSQDGAIICTGKELEVSEKWSEFVDGKKWKDFNDLLRGSKPYVEFLRDDIYGVTPRKGETEEEANLRLKVVAACMRSETLEDEQK